MVLLTSDSGNTSLGSRMPDFKLPSVDGQTYSVESFSEVKVLVVMFICNHCPYVQAIEDRLIELQRFFEGKSVQLIGICSNDPEGYPDDSQENLLKRWQEKDYRFPYLVDADQHVAKAFGAVCTPDLFVYDHERVLAYHGQLDDNWKEPDQVKKSDLRDAVSKLLEGEKLDPNQKPSMGCSIKWKA